MMLFTLLPTVLFVVTSSSAEDAQMPMLTTCSEIHDVTVVNLTVMTDSGRNVLNISFSMDVVKSLQANVTLEVAMMEKGMTSLIPCVEQVGSCKYKLCGGNSTMEMNMSKAWSNTCPIPASMYHVSMALDLKKNSHLTSGNSMKVFNYTFEDSGHIVGCVSFEVNVPSGSGSSAPSAAAFHVPFILAFSLFLLKFW